MKKLVLILLSLCLTSCNYTEIQKTTPTNTNSNVKENNIIINAIDEDLGPDIDFENAKKLDLGDSIELENKKIKLEKLELHKPGSEFIYIFTQIENTSNEDMDIKDIMEIEAHYFDKYLKLYATRTAAPTGEDPRMDGAAYYKDKIIKPKVKEDVYYILTGVENMSKNEPLYLLITIDEEDYVITLQWDKK